MMSGNDRDELRAQVMVASMMEMNRRRNLNPNRVSGRAACASIMCYTDPEPQRRFLPREVSSRILDERISAVKAE